MEQHPINRAAHVLVVSDDLVAAEAFASIWAPGPVFAQMTRTTPTKLSAGQAGGRPRLDLIKVDVKDVHTLAPGWSFEQAPVLVVQRPVGVLDITQPTQSEELAPLRSLRLPVMVTVGGVGYDEWHGEWFLHRGAGGFSPTSWGAARGALVVHLAQRIAAALGNGAVLDEDPSAVELWGQALCAPEDLCREALDLVAMGGVR